MTQLGGHAIYLDRGGRARRPRDAWATSPATSSGSSTGSWPARDRTRSCVELAAQAAIPVDQRPDDPRAPVPGAGRPVHAPRALRRPARAAAGVRRRRQQRLPLARAHGRDAGHGGPARAPGGLRPERAARRARVRESPPSAGGRLVVRRRPARGRRGRGGRLHRRLDVDGPGGRGRGAPRRLRAVPGQRRLLGDRARRRRDALPACASGRGDHVRRDGRPEEHHLRPVGEPAPRPEGAAGRAPRPADPVGHEEAT